jgi:uncharacterized protein (TIGR04255 family)
MPFPEVTRVIFRKNPLDRVICQLKFPPILRIDAEIPAQFQEKVRRHFPNFTEISEWNILVPKDLKGSIPIPPEQIRQAIKSAGVKNYEFSSEDEHWKINLTRTFVALTCMKYERWERFKDKLQIPLEALIQVYSPDYFSRVGLRYVDIIRRSNLNLSEARWEELLQPYISGILGAQELGNFVKNFESKYEIGLSDGKSEAKIITTFLESEDGGEVCYVIDCDFYNNHKTQIDLAIEMLDYFNVRASRLIQWCITRRLYEAMEPEDL